MYKLIATILCGALAAAAQTAPKRKIHVEGRVVSMAGEPLRRANVRLQSATGTITIINGASNSTDFTETTDDEGKFVFEDVAAGRYTLIAERAGYVPQRYGARSLSSPGTPLNLTEGQELKDLLIRLTAQGVIVGKVTDADGEPVPNVGIKVQRYAYSNGRKQLTAATSGAPGVRGIMIAGGAGPMTDDQGNFRIANLSPGRYFVSAEPQQVPGLERNVERPGRAAAVQRSNVNTFYPSSLDVQSAVQVDLAAGGEFRGVDIRLRSERTFSIKGKVTEASSGAPLANASIFIQPTNGGNLPSTSRSSQDGAFELRNVLPGSYTLIGSTSGAMQFTSGAGAGEVMMFMNVRGPGGGTDNSRSGRVDVSVGDMDATNIILPLAEGAEITGTVKLENGDLKDWLKPSSQQPQGPGGMLIGPSASPGLRLTTNESFSVNAPSTRFNEDGTFTLKGVGSAKYFVTVTNLPTNGFVKSMRLAGRDITRAPLDATVGAPGSLEIVISTKSASYSGTVKNAEGKPQAGTTVSLWPKVFNLGSTTNGIRTATTDQNGSFKIENIVPGDYYLAAWDNLPDSGIAMNQDFLNQFASAGNGVQFSEGAQSTGEAKWIAEDKILLAVEKIQ